MADNGFEQVGVLCDHCLMVFSVRPGSRFRCPSCEKVLQAPESSDVQQEPAPRRRVEPEPTRKRGHTAKELIAALYFGLMLAVVSVAVIGTVFCIGWVFFGGSNRTTEPERYKPKYPQYYDSPGFAPLDRAHDMTPDQKAAARDAVIEFEKAQGRMK
jgi:hypothetical protein